MGTPLIGVDRSALATAEIETLLLVGHHAERLAVEGAAEESFLALF